MKIKVYRKDVGGREALRIEVLNDEGVGVYINGRWCDKMDYDPLPLFKRMAERFLGRPLTDDEAKGLKMPEAKKRKKGVKADASD